MLTLLLTLAHTGYLNEIPVGSVDVPAIEIFVFERPVRVSYDVILFADSMEAE